MAYDLTAC